jgi:speckle-type POZ protein
MSVPPPPPCKGALTMICSYSEPKKVANNSYVESGPIDVGGHSWRIRFYPNGWYASNAGFMSVFLQLIEDADADDMAVHVKVRFEMHEVESGTMTFTSDEFADTFQRGRVMKGRKRFVSHEDFEKSALFKSDRFKIRCELTVFPAGSQPAAEASSSAQPPVVQVRPPAATPPPPPSGLHADLGRLLATKEGADVEIEVCGKVFAAHKSVLAARSSVFRAYFFGPTKEEDTSYVRIGDDDGMRPEAFEALLHYMYTDSLPEMMTKDSPERGAAAAEGLLVAADRYNLKDLKSVTENKLCSHVGVSTVLLLLALAERCQCRVLRKMCLGFIGSSSIEATKAIVASNNNVENLARSNPAAVKDVITEILDERVRRFNRIRNFYLFLFMPFVVFSFLHVTFL